MKGKKRAFLHGLVVLLVAEADGVVEAGPLQQVAHLGVHVQEEQLLAARLKVPDERLERLQQHGGKWLRIFNTTSVLSNRKRKKKRKMYPNLWSAGPQADARRARPAGPGVVMEDSLD
ncbi:DEAD-box ATP-dependent RNA helicase 3A, chloroplastic, partial [Frankliniella fusca]